MGAEAREAESAMSDAIKYPFGETPEAVIRGQFRASDGYLREHGQYGALLWFYRSVDELLTTLAALYGVTKTGSQYAVSGAMKLRIDILAALGIDESA